MVHVVASPGSCGEFIQGYGNGSSFMVTCPIDRYSIARSSLGEGEKGLSDKSRLARDLTLAHLGKTGTPVAVSLSSEIPVGKGMASSTADISAVCQATALACGHILTPSDIAAIAISIEPSDAIFYKGIVQFDYRRGRLIQKLGRAPAMKILVFDCGGEIDTLAFNSRSDLVSMQKASEKEIAKAMELFLDGMKTGNVSEIGKAATISAFANQRILPKEALDLFYQSGMEAGGRGVIAAHSGTVLGLLLEKSDPAEEIRLKMEAAMHGLVSYLDLVNVINQGMSWKSISDSSFQNDGISIFQ